jgi:hypothetical protein
MEIRKDNMEVRKNWNKFTFKKLGIVFCLFLFGVVAFVSGNLTQVNAASSSTVLPIAKGGTGSNSASGARTNLNAQEKLVSGTNIKSVFGQSLLGSGDVTNKTSGNTLSSGKYSSFQLGYNNQTYTIDEVITFNATARTVSFILGSWQAVYMHSINAGTHEPSVLWHSTETISQPITVTLKVPTWGFAYGHANTTNGGIYIVTLRSDNNTGFFAKVERL